MARSTRYTLLAPTNHPQVCMRKQGQKVGEVV